jgi:hypothetical protein
MGARLDHSITKARQKFLYVIGHDNKLLGTIRL